MQVVKLPRDWYAIDPRERVYMWTLYEAGDLDPAGQELCKRVDAVCEQALNEHLWQWLKTGRDVPSTQIVWTVA